MTPEELNKIARDAGMVEMGGFVPNASARGLGMRAVWWVTYRDDIIRYWWEAYDSRAL